MSDAIAQLGSISGLAFLSGIRLYSTVLVVGLGIRLGFLHLPERLSSLSVLGTTPVLIIAGTAYAAEFIADKIPWFDSVWDTVHTIIRPLGAAVLAATALGDVDPVVKIGAVLLSGAIALTGHSAKAGTRLLANHSPEPLSNIGLSLGEDALVVGGVWTAVRHPVITLVVVIILVAVILWTLPKLFRLFRRQIQRLKEAIRPGAVSMNQNQLNDFGTRYAAAWSSKSPESLAAFYAENGSLRVNSAPPAVGRAAVRDTAAGFMTGFPDMVVRMDSMVPTVNGATFHWVWTGTNTGPGGTGKAVRMTGYEELTFGADGLINQALGHFDEAEYQRQLRDGAPARP